MLSQMEAITCESRRLRPWVLLYADDLLLIAKSEEELFREKIHKWCEYMMPMGLWTKFWKD